MVHFEKRLFAIIILGSIFILSEPFRVRAHSNEELATHCVGIEPGGQKVHELMDKAAESQRRGDFKTTVKYYDLALKSGAVSVENVDFYFQRAQMFRFFQKPQLAIEDYEHYLMKHPDNSEALIGIALCNYDLKKYALAWEECKKPVAAQTILGLRGRILFKQGKILESLPYLEKYCKSVMAPPLQSSDDKECLEFREIARKSFKKQT